MKQILLAGVALVFVAGPALAWSPPHQRGAVNSAVVDGGQSQAQAQIARGGAGGAGGSASATGGSAVAHGGHASVTNNVNVDPPAAGYGTGSNNVTVNNATPRIVPPAYAPSIVGGDCSGSGLSGGVSTGWFSFVFGGNRDNAVCEAARFAGRPDVAFQLLCQKENVRQAAARTGVDCDGPKPPAPTPDYCDTVSKGDPPQYRAYCDEIRRRK